jgi:hypothetical protein
MNGRADLSPNLSQEARNRVFCPGQPDQRKRRFRVFAGTVTGTGQTVRDSCPGIDVFAGQTVPDRWGQVDHRLWRTGPLSLSIGEGTGPSPADAKKLRNQEKIRRTEYLAKVCRETSRDG